MAKRICIFTQSLIAAGAEKQAVMLAKALNEKFYIHVLVYRGNDCSSFNLNQLKESNINFTLLAGTHLKKVYQVYKVFKKYKFEIVFNYLLFPNILGGLISKITSVKFSIGGIRSSYLEKSKVLANRIAHNNINNFTVYNNYLGYKRYTDKGFKIEKARVISNCIEFQHPQIIRNDRTKIIILSVGRFNYAKDYITALSAVLKLSKSYKNFKYLIVGYGEEEIKIKNYINENSMNKYVDIVNNANNLEDIYRSADIYLQTSIFEGVSNTIMEAMSFSLPIIATNVGDNSKLIKNNYNGYLCKPKDVDEIFSKLLILIGDNNLRLEFGIRSYDRIKTNYSFERFKEQYEKFIDSLHP